MKKNQNNQIILKEGLIPIVITLGVSLFLKIFISDFLGNIGFIFTLALIYIYRNPNRESYHTKNNILAPIDGKISAIDITENNYKIYIDVNLCDTHLLRAPVAGKYKIKNFIHGLNLNSSTYKAKILNTQAILKFDNIKVRLISGMCNPNITLYKDNIKVAMAQSIGLFLHGTVIVEIPKDKQLQINLNDKVYAGITQLS